MGHFHCPVSSFQFPVSNVQCPMSNVQCPMSNVQCPMSNVQCPMSNVQCPMSNVQCPMSNVQCPVHYHYIYIYSGTFKQRFTQQKLSFKNNKYSNSTELSKYIWQLKDNKTDYQIQWNIITAAQPYSNISKRCDLCTSEKLYIMNGNDNNPLNKRSGLLSECRHENEYYLMNNSIT